jgi:hypothetical protein
MPARPRRLVVPSRLAFSTVVLGAAVGCSGAVPGDAGQDVVPLADIVTADRAGPDGAPEAAVDVALDGDATCVPQPFMAGYFECMADPRSDAGAGCNGQYVCTAGECGAGCVACPTEALREPGFTCLPLRGVDVATQCPPSRVCNAGDCPTGCMACNEPAFCTPDPSMDASIARCDPQIVCDPSGCPPGCIGLV